MERGNKRRWHTSFWKSFRNRFVASLFTLVCPSIATANNFAQVEAWTAAIGILQSDAIAEAKVFAATTLKGKVGFIICCIVRTDPDIIDNLRRVTTTPRCACRPSNTVIGILKAICARAPTDPHTALRMLGHPFDTNDRVEECRPNGGRDAWNRRGKPCMHAGIPQSPAGRSYRRT